MAEWNKNQIASAITTYLAEGLKGTDNISYIIPQFEAEIDLTRANIMQNLPDKKDIRISQLAQTINCLEIDCENLTQCCTDAGMRSKPIAHTEIPKLTSVRGHHPVLFLGTMEYNKTFKVYYDPSAARKHERSFLTRKEPYAWVDMTLNKNGKHNVWFWNLDLLKNATIIAIFEDPEAVYEYSCCNDPEAGYPAPNWMIDEIITTIATKYMNLYRKGLPNQIVTPDNNTYTT